MVYKYTNRDKFLVSVIFLPALFIIPVLAFANVEITEIMYDFPGTEGSGEHDWIEVHNNSAGIIDLSTFKLFEAGTNHGIKSIQGLPTLSPGAFAVVASNAATFLTDQPAGFNGQLFDSSFSLNSTSAGETLVIRTGDLSDQDSVAYSADLGAKDDGNSLQKTNGAWAAAAPTPGVSSSETSTTAPPEESSPSAPTEQSSGSSVGLQSLWADAGPDRTAIVGAGTIFEGKALGIDKNPLDGARYLWNFGDGFTGEGKKVIHTYKHPGDYIVYLDVANGSVSAGDKILVKAMPADVSISALGYGEKSFVAISNNEPTELDISFWQIKSSSGVFVIPKNTIIVPNNKIIFSKDALSFEIKEGDKVFLVYPNGLPAYEFLNNPISTTLSQPIYSTSSKNPQKPETVQKGYNNSEPEEGETDSESGNKSELTASVADSLPDNGNSGGMFKWLLGAFAVMAVSVIGALAIRNYGRRSDDSQEIKILE